MTTLALDISTKCGWAYGDGTPENTWCGTRVFNNSDYVEMYNEALTWFTRMMVGTAASLIVIEKAIYTRHESCFQMCVLHLAAHAAAKSLNIPRTEITPAAVKKHITGKGNCNKKAMIAAIKDMGFNPKDDNQADAIGILITHIRNNIT